MKTCLDAHDAGNGAEHRLRRSAGPGHARPRRRAARSGRPHSRHLRPAVDPRNDADAALARSGGAGRRRRAGRPRLPGRLVRRRRSPEDAEADIARTAAAGFVFFTLDPSDDVDQQADGYDAATLAATSSPKCATSPRGSTSTAAARSASIRPASSSTSRRSQRAAVKYGKAIQRAIVQCAVRRAGMHAPRPAVRNRAERRRNGPADDARRALHHRRPACQGGHEASPAWRRGSSATSRRASTTRATSPSSKRRCASTPRSPSGSAPTRCRSTRAPTSFRCTPCWPA